MKKLLFGINDTQECKRAVSTILHLFGNQKDIQLTLLHVLPNSMFYTENGMVDYQAIQDDEMEQSDILLNSFEKKFATIGIACEKILKIGNPIDVVLEIADNYDLLIIGASESSLLHRIFSSHQNSFVDSSPIPILVAK